MLHLPHVVIRADLGIDVLVGEPSTSVFAYEGPLVRAGLAAAFRHGPHHVGIEYAGFMDASRTHGYQRQYQTLAGTYRLALDKAEPFVAVVVPLAGPRETVDGSVGTALMLGLDVPLR